MQQNKPTKKRCTAAVLIYIYYCCQVLSLSKSFFKIMPASEIMITFGTRTLHGLQKCFFRANCNDGSDIQLDFKEKNNWFWVRRKHVTPSVGAGCPSPSQARALILLSRYRLTTASNQLNSNLILHPPHQDVVVKFKC
jgi:hypothetical protein